MNETITPEHQLPAGTILNGRYEIIRTLGEGGFGITYMGHNIVLDIPVAIKEYYPYGYANRSATYNLAVTITTPNQQAQPQVQRPVYQNYQLPMQKPIGMKWYKFIV